MRLKTYEFVVYKKMGLKDFMFVQMKPRELPLKFVTSLLIIFFFAATVVSLILEEFSSIGDWDTPQKVSGLNVTGANLFLII